MNILLTNTAKEQTLKNNLTGMNGGVNFLTLYIIFKRRALYFLY